MSEFRQQPAPDLFVSGIASTENERPLIHAAFFPSDCGRICSGNLIIFTRNIIQLPAFFIFARYPLFFFVSLIGSYLP